MPKATFDWKSLTEMGEIRVTPAMAAWITAHVCDLAELVAVA